MKLMYRLLALSALPLFAHPGHPGPEAHGDATHLMLGFLVVLPLLAGTAWMLRQRNLRRAAVVLKKDPNDG